MSHGMFRAAASTVLGVIATVGLSLTPAQAGIVTVGFDDVATGTLTTGYTASKGVTFSGLSIVPYVLSPATYPGLPSVFYAAGNQSGSIVTTVVTANFASDVSNVSMLFADTETGSLLGRMKAFSGLNGTGTLLADTGNITTPSATYPGYAYLLSSVSGIRSIQFYTDADGAIVDSLTYNVPAPGALALLGVGLLGLVRRKRV